MKTDQKTEPRQLDMKKRRFLSYYEAYAVRSAMPNPTDWLILPEGSCQRLVSLGGES